MSEIRNKLVAAVKSAESEIQKHPQSALAARAAHVLHEHTRSSQVRLAEFRNVDPGESPVPRESGEWNFSMGSLASSAMGGRTEWTLLDAAAAWVRTNGECTQAIAAVSPLWEKLAAARRALAEYDRAEGQRQKEQARLEREFLEKAQERARAELERERAKGPGIIERLRGVIGNSK